MQYYVTIVLILGFQTGVYIINGIEFLEAIPNHGEGYLCLDSDKEWKQCSQKYICESKLRPQNWKIDYSAPNTFHNWVDPEVLNLTCVDTKIIGLVGSAYFLGFAISSSIIPPLSDRIGRKWPYISSLALQLGAYVLIFLSKNIWLTILGYLIVGLCAGGRVVVGMNYMCEFVPEK